MKLLVRPRPTPDNSLAGYLMTVANRNGMTFGQWCGMLDLPEKAFHNPGDVMYGRSAVAPFGQSIGLMHNTLQPMVYATDRTWKRPSQVRYRDMQVPFVLMRGASAPVCPMCIAEKRVPEADWDLVLHTACTHHSLRLVTHCPACTKPLQWHRSQVGCCPCGFELQNCSPTSVGKALRFGDQQELMRVAVLVAFELADAAGTLRLDALRELPIEALDTKVLVAANALRAGRENLSALLRSIAKRRAEQNAALGQRWPLLPVLMGVKDETAVSDWLRANVEGLSDHTGGAELSIETLSLAETAVLLDVSEHVVKQRCTTGQLRKLADRTGQTPMLICARSIAAYLREPSPPAAPQQVALPDGLVTVTEAASQLNIYPDAIRRVIKAGLLTGQKGVGTQVLLRSESLRHCQLEYVFVKELAAAWATNHTNLAERLMAVGIQPVSGPSIDGGLVYLFRRAEVNDEVRQSVCSLTGYATRAGRKLAGKQEKQLAGYLTAQQVADDLGISTQQVARLVANGHLEESRPDGITSNRRYISERALATYRDRFHDNRDLLTMEQAAAELELTVAQVNTRYLMTGELRVVTDGITRYVLRSEVNQIRERLQNLVSAADASKLLGAPRYYLNNLVKIGQLEPANPESLKPKTGYPVRHYFRRQDIEELKTRRSMER